MANYRYQVITRSGEDKKGLIAASDRQHAMENLRAEGNTVLSLDNPSIFDTQFEIPILRPKVKPRDMSIFCRQFVTLMEAGISIVQALEMLEEQTVNKILKESIRETRAEIEHGETLADAMRHQDKVFSSMFCNLVQAGEQSGKLEVSFSRMAEHFEKSARLRNVVTKAMIYPVILAFVATVVIIVMLTYIVPMFADMFEQMDAELPKITQIVVGMSDFFIAYWWLLLIVLVLVIFGAKTYGSTPSGQYLYDHMALKLPLLGSLLMKTACANFSRNLSTMLGSGVSIIEALHETAATMGNVVYRDCILDAAEQVSRGIPLSEQLKESGIFPPMVYHMVSIGEATGGMDTMLDKVADYYEEEVVAATEKATAALEPMVIIFMAVIVIAIIAAVFTPMLTMYSAIDNL
jgi:type IV pilus assembly protein PilC